MNESDQEQKRPPVVVFRRFFDDMPAEQPKLATNELADQPVIQPQVRLIK
jgi:hypothetical protein